MNHLTHILIVDDEPNIRLMVRTVLEAEGYRVSEAGNGQEALEIIEDGNVDLLVLDLNMPVLDGMSVLQQLHETDRTHAPRVIVLTAFGSIPAAVKATRLGALDFLEKPITPEDLRSTIAAVLKEPEPAKSHADVEDRGGYVGVLDRIRRAFRMSDVATAETLLMKAADLSHHDAAYLNLLGVLYESRSQWRLARKFYGKAMRAQKNYASAEQNMRRVFELYTFGRSKEPVALGDEPGDAWFNRELTNQEKEHR